jgi:hypothetical protein
MIITRSALALFLLVVSPLSVVAQGVVRGRVIEEATSAPIPGALISAADESGNRVTTAFADPLGGFTLRPLPLGSYLVTAEMIGRRSVTVELVLGPAARPIVLQMPADPIRLSAIDISVERRCASSGGGAGIALVWGEVQKALRAASATREQALYRFRVAVPERQLNSRNRRVLEEVTEERVVTGYDPFSSLAPEELAERGYIVDEGGEPWIFGPSTEVLLARSFEDTHCFALRRDRDKGLIGLAFEPIPRRSVADIQGVLWLEESSGELRTLEFSYLNLPRDFVRGRYEGFASFRRLDVGSWTIDAWRLSSPDISRLNRLQERAGEVLEATRIPDVALLP